VDELLAAVPLVLRRGPFVLAAWPPSRRRALLAALAEGDDEPALALVDDRELTLLLREPLPPHLPAPERREEGFSLLTLDTPMAWDVVGVLARLSGALAEAGIPLGCFAAFSRDHLLLPAARLDDARPVLQALCAGIEVRA
jgi:hypothetical protein